MTDSFNRVHQRNSESVGEDGRRKDSIGMTNPFSHVH